MTNKRQPKKRAAYRLASRPDRADFFFFIYEALGPQRTIRKVWELCRQTGVGFKTLEKYSRDFAWQRRILERAADREKELQLQAVDIVKEMTDRQADFWKGVHALAAGGLSFYQAKIEQQIAAGINPSLDMTLDELVRLGEASQRGERLARGLATSKVEVIIEVVAPLVKELMSVFLAVNVITNDDPNLVNKRQAEFIKRGDAILATYYNPVKALKGGSNVDT